MPIRSVINDKKKKTTEAGGLKLNEYWSRTKIVETRF